MTKRIEFGEIAQNKGYYYFEDTDVNINRKPVCDFLLVINAN